MQPFAPARVRLGAVALLVALAAACAGRGAAPSPADPPRSVPDLRGQRVMLFPVQALEGVDAGADAELAFALAQRGGQVEWVLAEQMRRASAGSPALQVRLEGLPVGVFLQAEVRRVGDPLYGYLRRMAALVAADLALVPVVARYRPARAEAPSGVEIAAALLSARTGDVLWFGIVQGLPGEAQDPRALASAAEALGRRLLPLAGASPE